MKSNRYMADISSNNGRVDIGNYSRAGHSAIAIKATEGNNYVNPFHLEQCATAHDFGLTVVHYHFCRPGKRDIAGEIRLFRSTYLKGWRKGDRVCFDIEVAEVADMAQYASLLIGEFKKQTGHTVILYTGKDFAEEHLRGVLRVEWWIADYGPTILPQLPKGFKLFGWQYTNGTDGIEPHFYTGIGKSDGTILNVGFATTSLIRKNTTRHRRK